MLISIERILVWKIEDRNKIEMKKFSEKKKYHDDASLGNKVTKIDMEK